jgi:hypothetical protein
MSSYNDGLEHGQNPYQTMAATEVACTKIGQGKYCVTGVVEQGAEVTLFGDGVKTESPKVIDGRFLAVVEIYDENAATQICISVKSGQKSMSDVAYVFISEDMPVNFPDPVFVGKNGMLYYDNYDSGIRPDNAQIEAFKQNINAYFDRIKQKNSYANAETIFVLLPEKISVYDEGLDENLQSDADGLLARRELLYGALEESGLRILDTVSTLKLRARSLKMYYQSGEGITDTASYYLYRDIMIRVADRFHYAAPHALESERYSTVNRKLGAGTLAKALGFSNATFNESADRISVNGRFEYVVGEGEVFDFAKAFTTVHENYDLPTAVVVRDGNCDKLVEMLADNFSSMYVLEKGVTEIPDGILEAGVDYVIVLAPEGNINISE